ncbi:MotE family protein [Helicobacter sp. 11S02629-2]|uniref:MotE family protein n=1 Tax=Helicobacter sp. 11S02629-2 TaxID=1476195 RepID=UPI000BA633F4|nr:MotE family protein [Helicobacter sp. 11S02629-2]PAF44972.1 hypothetical protein BKH40_04615 [Helicobacter sp. 11S02629-2]
MKKILLIVAFSTFGALLSAKSTTPPSNNELIDINAQCNAIFEDRKQEISASLMKLRQEQTTLQILSSENSKLLAERKAKLDMKEKALEQMYKEMKQEEAKKESESKARLQEAKTLLAQNEKVLADIKSIKDSKLAESYAKMRDSNAAPILASMPAEDAISILLSLKPAEIGKILAKMDPKTASELTQKMQGYPLKTSTSSKPINNQEKNQGSGSSLSPQEEGSPSMQLPKAPTPPSVPTSPSMPSPNQSGFKTY